MLIERKRPFGQNLTSAWKIGSQNSQLGRFRKTHINGCRNFVTEYEIKVSLKLLTV